MGVRTSGWFPYWDRGEDLRESIGRSGPCVMRFRMKIRKDLHDGGRFNEGASRWENTHASENGQ
jgi:hypothetical protein